MHGTINVHIVFNATVNASFTSEELWMSVIELDTSNWIDSLTRVSKHWQTLGHNLLDPFFLSINPCIKDLRIHEF
jgi:hypothetical protein